MKNIAEWDLVKFLTEHLESLGYRTLKELSVGYGRADVVACMLNKEKVARRIEAEQYVPILNIFSLALYLNFPNEVSIGYREILEISKDIVNNSQFISANCSVRRTINWLILNKYIIKKKNKYYKLNNIYRFSENLIAIEVKISDWLKGARQAYRYRVFADNIYLAFPSRNFSRINADILLQNNIGIISIDINKKILIFNNKPENSKPNLIRHSLALEYFWDSYISSIRRQKNVSK